MRRRRRSVRNLLRLPMERPILLHLLLLLLHPASSHAKHRKSKRSLNSSHLCFPVIGDIGGVPYPPYTTPSQKDVAALLGKVSSQLKCQFVVGVGDNFYFDGVANSSDPRFRQTFERTYDFINLPWYMIAGNHDHVRNVTAQIGYSKVSKRWKYPFFYYSEVHAIPDSDKKIEIIMIDTTMLCWQRRISGAPSPQTQWKWIEKKLHESTSDYLLVAGHHPVLSGGLHGNTNCLVKKLKPMLEKYEVTAYFSGHDHNLQHIKERTSDVHYFVTGSGNFVDGRMWNRDKLPLGSLKFENGLLGGFILLRASDKSIRVTILNSTPKELWKLKMYPRTKNKQKNIENKTNSPLPALLATLENESLFETRNSPFASSLYAPMYAGLPADNTFASVSPNPLFYNNWFYPNTPNLMYANRLDSLPFSTQRQDFNFFTNSAAASRALMDADFTTPYYYTKGYYRNKNTNVPIEPTYEAVKGSGKKSI